MYKGRGASGRSLIGALGILLALPLTARAHEPLQLAAVQPPAVYREALAAVAPCMQAAGAACAKRGFSAFTSRLATEIDALPSGRAGLAAWLRFAARLHRGSIPTAPAVRRMPLRSALEQLYARIGYEPDKSARAEIDGQLARLSKAASEEIAALVGAFDLSLRLAEQARGDSGIERWMGDPRRAHLLAMQAMRAPDEAGTEARRLLDATLRVDMDGMTQAALVMTDALVEFDASNIDDSIDLPLIFIGGEGHTVHTENRLILIDVSGADTYLNNAGGGLVDTPIFPLGGSFAADLGAGDDVYDYEIGAQGYAMGGVGILYDEGGSDLYHLGDSVGQGRGYAGVGVLYDVGRGDDRYLAIWEEGELTPLGTKGSSVAGIGLLIDEGGSDVFRQDGLDGIAHGTLGGLAVLASLGPGDDTVRSDGSLGGGVINLTPPGEVRVVGVMQGNAEVRGVGILYDEAGDDRYICNDRIRQGCQGTSDDSSLAMLWDRAGDDSYFAEAPFGCDVFDTACPPDLPTDVVPIEWPILGPLGQGAAYVGLPATGATGIGALYDESGDDRYVAPKWAQGYGALGSLGLLYDTGGGNDVYDTRAPLVGSRADGHRWIDGLLGIGIDE